MSIIINDNKLFHLQTSNTSYIFKVLKSGHLGHLYYGNKIRNNEETYKNLYHYYSLEQGSSTTYKDDKKFNLNVATLEYPTYGKGDYREPAISLLLNDGSRVSDFLYKEHKVYKGKNTLKDLPSIYHNDINECDTIEIHLYDEVIDVSIILYYSVFSKYDIITRSIKVINGSKQTIELDKVMSLNIDFIESDFELLTLDGAWIRERHINTRKLNQGVTYIDSKKGVSSSDHNPFICLKRENTNENLGECYGFGLIYSGNHQELIEVSPFDLTRVQLGINPFDFKWSLNKQEEFQTPEAIFTYSNNGLNKMSNNFHNIIKHNLVRGDWKYKERPVLVNNWEATYFNFNEKKLLSLAKKAIDMGIELFVLDDGWFGKRNDDTTSLGDWYVNTKKLPNGVDGLAKKVNDLGLDFGIWVEPEMISFESDLYKQHPEWVMKLPNRGLSLGRNQAILDLANPEVCDYIFNVLSDLFKSANITYVKWDMNRNFSDIYSNYLDISKQSEISHRYVLGLYSILERLNNEFPHILFESCSSGGNRFDLGMLYYMPQVWTSDNTDALERQYIQYGTSLLYPPSVIGAHVSGEPNHQVLRNTPVESRFNVAAFGLLGYELDLTKLSNFDQKVIKKQIKYYKEHRKLLQYGNFYRIKSPFESNNCIWMSIDENKDEAMLGYYQKLTKPNPGYESIKLIGLNEDTNYNLMNRTQYLNIRRFGELINEAIPVNIKTGGLIHNVISDNYLFALESEDINAYGDELMYAGFRPKHQFTGTGYTDNVRYISDVGSRMYHIKKK